MTQAYVQEIQPKATSAGTMHDFIMSNGDKLGAGKFPPKGISAGDYVEYDVEMRGQYKNLKAGSMRKLPAPAGVTPPTSNAPTTGGRTYQSNDNRQVVISKQAALNSAIAFVNLLAATDSLPTIAKAKADVKADLMQEVVDRYTAHFYLQSTGEQMEFPDSKVPAGLGSAESDTNWSEE